MRQGAKQEKCFFEKEKRASWDFLHSSGSRSLPEFTWPNPMCAVSSNPAETELMASEWVEMRKSLETESFRRDYASNRNAPAPTTVISSMAVMIDRLEIRM